MTFDEFLAKYQNKSNDFDGYYGAQCFDLFQFYNRDVVGAPFVTGAGAKDIWNTYPKDFYERIDNTPTAYPKKGDVIIWGSAYGPYGHVAVASEDGNPQTDSFTVLSQNDPAGVPSIYKTYKDWKGVLGWLRPKPKAEDPLQACLRQHTELVTQVETLKKQVEQGSMLIQENSSLKLRVLTLEKDLASATEAKNRYQKDADEARNKLNQIHVISG